MPRAIIAQGSQIGIETTEGTSVAANRRLSAIGFDFGTDADFQRTRPVGKKYPSSTTLLRERGSFDLVGGPDYNDLAFILASIICVPTSAVMGATPAYSHVYDPATASADVARSFTVERGQSGAGNAEKFVGAKVSDFNIDFNADGEIEIGGGGLARAIQFGQTITATPLEEAAAPILMTQVNVYLEDSYATIIGTPVALGNVFMTNFSLGSRFGPYHVIGRANGAAMAGTVETEPDAQMGLQLINDAAAQALATTMRAGSRKFLRIQALGPVISGANTYLLDIVGAVMVAEAPELDESQDVDALGWTFDLVHETTLDTGMAYKVTLQNRITTAMLAPV